MAVLARLAKLPLLRQSSYVSGYRATRGELDIDAALILLREASVIVTVPRVVGEYLQFVAWDPEAETSVGSFGIEEPTGARTVPLDAHDVVLAPLVAFDRQGHRLGQGGGYYDRALAGTGSNRPVFIGVAHSFQEVDAIPTEPWDVPLDAVVTEDGVIEFKSGVLEPPSH